MVKGREYAINNIVYVATSVHEKSVILHIDDAGAERGFFLPDKYADAIRNHYEDPKEINCFELYLEFKGFTDEEKKINPMFEIIYKGSAQHSN